MGDTLRTTDRPLFELWPVLRRRLEFADLGLFPTPVEPLSALAPASGVSGDVYVKRDDLSASTYAGNKVRTLEAFFGRALADGVAEIFSTGAYGSNHALATVLHAPRVGLRPGALLFPQPWSEAAAENLRLTATRAQPFLPLAHWSLLPWAMWRLAAAKRRQSVPCAIMPPGGATPLGALGYVSAALELAQQLEQGVLPPPQEIVIGVGSTCTSAGLLLGLSVALRRAFGWKAPGAALQLVSVRVTPWPVTSAFRIVGLALRTAARLRELTGDAVFDFTRAELAARLTLDGSHLGRGYGLPSQTGRDAIARLAPFGSRALDTTYASKSAAGLLARCGAEPGQVRLFWSTKSSLPLPEATSAELERAPRAVQAWLARRG